MYNYGVYIHLLRSPYLSFYLCPLACDRVRRMAGMKETQLTADVELLTSGAGEAKSKQQTRPPISMNFEVY